ncbi:MAG: hypothetical protein B7C24_12850 [Bacteroidetes bacterium 4572_77]|nr:MAG: hypothetical protein B7C24_12850 [Bacteroidetes bacterium 4572_77]
MARWTNISAERIALMINVSESTVDKDIRKLKEEEVIKREGSRKTGKWILIKTKTHEQQNNSTRQNI